MDIVSKDKRSQMMANIKNKNTNPEVLIRKELFRRGFRYRINIKDVFGKPDILLHKYQVVIFIHGCFWHGHKCKYFKIPETNTIFWTNKINKNRDRDLLVQSKLQSEGWRIACIWECSIKKKETLSELLDALSLWILSDDKKIDL